MPQSIEIQLSPATLTALKELGYALYVMRAFNTTNAAGKPLVWIVETNYLENNQLTFDSAYAAYVSTSQVIANGVVVASSYAPVEIGQTATVAANGELTVTVTGNPAGITLVNGSTTPYTTGVAAAINGQNPAPIFAEPLFGLAEDIAAPLDKFLLTFSTQGVTPGTLVEHAMSQSLLVDISNLNQASVNFDINTGWNAAGAAWATPVAAGTNLIPVLVHEQPMVALQNA